MKRIFIYALVFYFAHMCAFGSEPEVRKVIDQVLKEVEHHSSINTELILAFAKVESSCDPNVIGDNGKAWGLFQFHQERWLECGGTKASYRTCKIEKQVRVMVCALNRYMRKCPSGVDPVRWMGTSHNIGHGVNQETAYVKKLRKAM